MHIKRVINVTSGVASVNRGAMLSKASQSSPQASSLQSEVTEVEKDLTLRCLLWESLQEWQGLVDQWEATPFETLKIDAVQQDVTRFIQTIFLLEKGNSTVRGIVWFVFLTLINRLDIELSGGYRYPTFEQLEPDGLCRVPNG